mmetsp:Transcript_32802/g.67749  ORF Transcript_32802/g.67749 Transcript_32802/m.67749 type:complete len:210 (+) Transcript_32802:120-749(+)
MHHVLCIAYLPAEPGKCELLSLALALALALLCALSRSYSACALNHGHLRPMRPAANLSPSPPLFRHGLSSELTHGLVLRVAQLLPCIPTTRMRSCRLEKAASCPVGLHSELIHFTECHCRRVLAGAFPVAVAATCALVWLRLSFGSVRRSRATPTVLPLHLAIFITAVFDLIWKTFVEISVVAVFFSLSVTRSAPCSEQSLVADRPCVG